MSEANTQIIHDSVTEKIIACCFEVHTALGPGFPEKIYHSALMHSMAKRKMKFVSEKEFEVSFDSLRVGTFRCDFLVEGSVIVEIKSVTGYIPVLFRNQVISYLKASGLKTGLLINFGNKSCEVKRVSN